MRSTPLLLEATPGDDYVVHVRFEDGTQADVDLGYLAYLGGVFEPLRDPEYFRQLRIYPEGETIFWPNEADIAPETLYAHAQHRAGGAAQATEIITVTEVEPLEGYVIRVTFSDGAVKEIDLTENLANARGVFVALRDPQIFSEVRVNEASGTVEWPGEVDLDPEVLYGLFEPASGPPMRRRTVREPTHGG